MWVSAVWMRGSKVQSLPRRLKIFCSSVHRVQCVERLTGWGWRLKSKIICKAHWVRPRPNSTLSTTCIYHITVLLPSYSQTASIVPFDCFIRHTTSGHTLVCFFPDCMAWNLEDIIKQSPSHTHKILISVCDGVVGREDSVVDIYIKPWWNKLRLPFRTRSFLIYRDGNTNLNHQSYYLQWYLRLFHYKISI